MYATFSAARRTTAASASPADSQGHAYVAGLTTSLNFPRAGGASEQYHRRVGRLRGENSAPTDGVVWAAYFGRQRGGGRRATSPWAAAGQRTSRHHRLLRNPHPHAFQPSKGSANNFIDAYVAKLQPTGALDYSTYLGGWRPDQARPSPSTQVAAYVTRQHRLEQHGQRDAAPFPTTPARTRTTSLRSTSAAATARLVTKLSPRAGSTTRPSRGLGNLPAARRGREPRRTRPRHRG